MEENCERVRGMKAIKKNASWMLALPVLTVHSHSNEFIDRVLVWWCEPTLRYVVSLCIVTGERWVNSLMWRFRLLAN